MSVGASWLIMAGLVGAVFGALALSLGVMAARSREHDERMSERWLMRQQLRAEQTLYDQALEPFDLDEAPRVVVCRSCRAPLRMTSARVPTEWEHRSAALNRDHHATPMPG